MSYYFDRFEYWCAEAHHSVFDLAYVADEPSPFAESKPLSLPEKLPCLDCQYKLVPVSLVLQTHSNLSEVDFCKFQEDKYVESVAYHEAAHVVVAAAKQIPLREGGICIDQKGSGFSRYEVVKPDGSTNLGPEPKREKTIRSTQAGYIAQEKFYLRFFDRLPPSGSSDDTDGINRLVEEMYSGRTVCEDAKSKLFAEAHLNRRITATLKRDSTGEITEQQIEQPSAGNPSDGPKVIAKNKYVVKYAATGTQKTKTVENRDANGKFKTVLVEMQESTQAPHTQHATLPSHNP